MKKNGLAKSLRGIKFIMITQLSRALAGSRFGLIVIENKCISNARD